MQGNALALRKAQMTDPRHTPTPIPASRSDLPRKAPPPAPTTAKPMSSKVKKVTFGCLGLFVVLIVIGGIGSAIEKSKQQKAAGGAPTPPPAPSSEPASTATPTPVPATTPAAKPSGPADRATLAKRADEARARLQSEQEKHGCFQVNGKISERTDDMLMLWGKALIMQGTSPQAMGFLFEDGNIIVKGYDKNGISYDQYLGVAYFAEQKRGKNSFGQQVPVNIYTTNKPASLAAAEKANATAQAELEQVEAPISAANKVKSEPVFTALLAAMPSTDARKANVSRNQEGDTASISWKTVGRQPALVERIEVRLDDGVMQARINGKAIGGAGEQSTKGDAFISDVAVILSALSSATEAERTEAGRRIFDALMAVIDTASREKESPITATVVPGIELSGYARRNVNNEPYYFLTIKQGK